MVFDRNSASIIILLSLPLQFNFITDSYNILKVEIPKEWKTNRKMSYYEDYFAEKITYYIGMITAVSLVFLYYSIRRMRIVISIGFIYNAIVWLIYLSASEKSVYMFIVVRGLQGISISIFQMSHSVYIMYLANQEVRCFCGGLFQATMFLGLLILNFLFYCCSWRVVCIIFAVQSILFAGTIWLVPEIRIKPKSQTCEYIINKKNRRSLCVMIFIMVLQQLSGIGILLGNLSQILSNCGLYLDPYLQSCLFDLVAVLATFIAAVIMDYIGTRYMWSFSAFGLCIGLVVYGITLKVELMGWVACLGVFSYFLFYGLGEGPIPWFLCGTLFPEEVRIESAAINVFENFFFFPILQILWNNLNKGAGQFGSIIFSLADCFLAIFCGFLIPLNKKSKDEIVNVL